MEMKLCVKWQQSVGYASKAPISKHQIPNNIQIPISPSPFPSPHWGEGGGEGGFGHLVIGNYLEFGIWILGFRCLFGSGYAGLGIATGD
jgi:hypothetical protein